MIDNRNHPVAWALLLHELDDAKEHLEHLISQMASDQEIDEIDFQTQLGHVYSHLNRAWHGRNDGRDTVSDAERTERSRFPKDLEAI